jgi:hypothetical protein
MFQPNQLEQRYGGTAPNVEEGHWWPSRFPSKDVGVDQSKLVPEADYEAFIQSRPYLKRNPKTIKQE